LPLHDHDRRVEAMARCVELHAARERISCRAGLEVELVDLFADLDLVGNACPLERFLDDPGVAVAREPVLRDPRLARLFLIEVTNAVLPLQFPIGRR
jgi:hypothetical protein